MTEPGPAAQTDTPILVIGFGNSLRGDDAVGLLLAERINAAGHPGVRGMGCAQLLPEHASWVAGAGVVVFVDAMIGGERCARLRPLTPARASLVTTHLLVPETLLALTRTVYGHVPRAWLLAVPVAEMGFSEQLSPLARASLAEAGRILDDLIRRHRSRSRKTPVPA